VNAWTANYPAGTYLFLDTRIRGGLNGPILGPDDIGSLKVQDPKPEVPPYSMNYSPGEFYAYIPKELGDFSTGEYLFTVRDKSERETNCADYLNRVKLLDIVELLSPADGTSVGTTTPTFSWITVPGAVRYWVAIDDEDRNRVFNGPRVTETEYTLEDPTILEHGKKYYWRVRAEDGIDGPRTDNRSESLSRWFTVE
jgi:hypothetical protein